MRHSLVPMYLTNVTMEKVMMNGYTLVFDTETTDKINRFSNKFPYMIQGGFVLSNRHGKVIRTEKFLVKPNGWTITPGAFEKHGISMEMLEKDGIDIKDAVNITEELINDADVIVAHNYEFDKNIISTEFARNGKDYFKLVAGKYQDCTQKLASTITAIDPTPAMIAKGKGPFKSPKLIEAYEFFFPGETFDGHDALNDSMACQRIYFRIVEKYPHVIRESYSYDLQMQKDHPLL